MRKNEGRSLPETPTWAVATVVIILVSVGIFFHGCLMWFGKWLSKTKRKPLLAVLEKIKDELMLFGLLSLLMGHSIIFVSKVCVKSSGLSRDFYLCAAENDNKGPSFVNHLVIFDMESRNTSFSSETDKNNREGFCPEGHQPFASYESLEQLHRLLFVLGVTHVLYSFYAIALTVLQMYGWRKWENHAMELALQASCESNEASKRMTRLTTFVSHHTSHPWSNHRVFVWLGAVGLQYRNILLKNT